MPTLPVSVLPTNTNSQMVVMQIASVFGAVNNFVFSEGVVLPESRYGDVDVIGVKLMNTFGRNIYTPF